VASALAFTVGACLPLLAIVLAPTGALLAVTVVAVLVALALAGLLSARLGGSPARMAVLRLVIGGAAGLGLTYAIGRLFGTAVG
jgi:VIT1/CCC1 family predicted Fe2+/Mn2+ transporter